jgi:hypothetical protein
LLCERYFADDDEKQELLDALIARPEAGAVIPKSGGLRKLRWKAPGRGKRGGFRVIYFWQIDTVLFLVLIYPKNEMEDLSPAQLKVLKRLVQEEFKR